jgi:hypothetical protein
MSTSTSRRQHDTCDMGFIEPSARTPGPVMVATRPVADTGRDSAAGNMVFVDRAPGFVGANGNCESSQQQRADDATTS